MKVQLVHCPDDYETGMQESKWYTPLNLLSLGTYLSRYGKIEVEILDGQLLTVKEISNKLEAPLIGFSFTCNSSRNLDRLVSAAKSKGAQVVVGGQAATPLAYQLLCGNKNIDFVVMFEGERAMLALAENKPFNEVPNLAYRDRDGRVHIPTDIDHVSLEKMPIPNRSLKGVHIERHIEIFQRDTGGNFGYSRPTNVYTKRGCPKRVHGEGCSFCSRIDKILSLYTPEKAWDEYYGLHQESHIDCIVDFSDDYICGAWLRKFANLCEKRGKPVPMLRNYAGVEDMTEENVSLLKKIGVKTVLLGIESGDEEVIRQNGKNYSGKEILKVAKMLGQANISLADAYVLGLIGETRTSIRKTIQISDQVRELCQTEISYWNICTPLPGSKIWKLLMADSALKQKYGNDYHIDTEILEREFIKRFTEVTYEYLQEIRRERVCSSRTASTEFTSLASEV